MPERGPSRGRPRDIDVDRRILIAARDLLLVNGYATLSIDEVADRAGVAKTTLYRRWPAKDHLIVAVVIGEPVDHPCLDLITDSALRGARPSHAHPA